MPLRLLPCLLGGLLLWLAQPGFDVWPAAPVGVALLAWGMRGAGARRGALLGLAGGLAYLTPLLSWTGIYVGPLPWLALCLLESLYIALLGALLGGVVCRDRYFPLWVAGAWVTSELLRSTTPYGGFPWARLAFSQADAPFARVAALAGAPGVTAAVALCGGALAVAAGRLSRAPRRPSVAVAPLLVAVGLGLAPLAVRLPEPPAAGTTGSAGGVPAARVMAIQGNVPQEGLEFNAQRRAVLDNHAALTAQAAAQLRAKGERAPDLVVWPENAADIDPLRNADAARVISDAVSAIGAPTVVGAVLSEPVDHVTNASLLYVPGSPVPTQRYDKRHPVPFAEYIPQRDFFRLFSDKVDLVARDFVGGDRVGVLTAPRLGGEPQVAAGVNICFEVAYDDLVRDGVTHGANLILVQTNNATFGHTHESVQQLSISRLRAIEHGRSVVHISNVGVSSLITPDGTPHGWTPLFEQAVLTTDLPLHSELTLATRLGDAPALGTALATLLVAFRAWWQARRRMTTTPSHSTRGSDAHLLATPSGSPPPRR